MNRNLVMSGDYKNHVKLNEINTKIKYDAKGFVDECENIYNREIDSAAKYIANRLSESRIVMLAGPSGSGKTTSAARISRSLAKLGIKAHNIGMDDYFIDVDRSDKTINYETPDRLDLPLMIEHMDKLSNGEEVWLPVFDFICGKQTRNVNRMQLMSDEVAIFEGIHALNDIFRQSKSDPTDIYVSARMRITDDNGNVLVEPEQTRFLRRGVRDCNFRGADFNRTLELWKNVILGEMEYIMPFKKYADIMIDTSMDYEVNLLAQYALKHFDTVNMEAMTAMGMGSLHDTLKNFSEISPSLVPHDSLLREFIGSAGDNNL